MHKSILRMPHQNSFPQRKVDWLWRDINLGEFDSQAIEDFEAIDSVQLPEMRLDLAPLIKNMR